MAYYAKDDCRNHGGPIIGAESKMKFIAVFTGVNRHEKRVARAVTGKKNTRGFPLGYNAVTWQRACVNK